LRGQLLQLAAQLGHLLRGLPIHELGLAAGFFQLLGLGLAQNLGLDRAGGREHLFHEAGTEIDTGLDQHRVHHLVGSRELSTAGCIVAQAGAAQAFLVELVALGAGVLVTLDLVEQVNDRVGQHAAIDLVDNVGEVSLLVGHVLLVLHADDRATVLGIFNLQIVVGHGDGFASLLIVAWVLVFAVVQELVSHVFSPRSLRGARPRWTRF